MTGKSTFLFSLLLLLSGLAHAQVSDSFCINGVHRAWWDVQHYELHVKFDIEKAALSGYNIITSKTLLSGQSIMQIDMQLPMVVDSVKPAGGALKGKKPIPFMQEDNMVYVMIPFGGFNRGEEFKVKIFFHGQPPVAQRPPWDGGLVISADAGGKPWWGMACQGNGASIWWPCKDYRGDEPDKGVELYYEVPKTLKAIGNGRLEDVISKKNTDIWVWKTESPINLYDVTFYIGDFAHWSETFQGLKGDLSLDYYVLPENLESSKTQFTQVPEMLRCFEDWLGPYPFYSDGYKLVDAPFLGMEHQSAVAYGNGYRQGYLGTDRSKSGFGMKFDFIIVHESGHEWFGNSITAADIADEWIHEGFTSYAETIFVECQQGKEAAIAYQRGKKNTIKNDEPVQGTYNTCDAGSGDRYDKAGMMIHAIRTMIADDSIFKSMLRTMNDSFRHRIVRTDDVLLFINGFTQKDFSKIFEQYLTRKEMPTLALMNTGKKVMFRWMNCVKGFNMPVTVRQGDEDIVLTPTFEWQELPLKLSKKQEPGRDDFYFDIKWIEKK